MKRLTTDYSTFAKNLDISRVVIIIIYINNFLFFGPDIIEINTVKSFLANYYKVKDLEPCSQFTETKQKQNFEKKTISLFQKVYI